MLYSVLQVAPEFFLTPNSTVVANHSGSLVLTCVAFGVPAPSVQWERFGAEIPESAIVSWISDDVEFISSTLELCDLQISDSGLYSCIANNSVGEIQHNFTVTFPLSKRLKNVRQSSLTQLSFIHSPYSASQY